MTNLMKRVDGINLLEMVEGPGRVLLPVRRPRLQQMYHRCNRLCRHNRDLVVGVDREVAKRQRSLLIRAGRAMAHPSNEPRDAAHRLRSDGRAPRLLARRLLL